MLPSSLRFPAINFLSVCVLMMLCFAVLAQVPATAVPAASAAARPMSKEARAHLSESLNTLTEALKAPMQRKGV